MGCEMRILIVEDERTLAGFIEQSLHAEGYAVTVVYDGGRAELEALTGDYGLVLLDVMLPGRNGLDVLDTIRARKPELPVILLTARGAIEQKVEGLDRGANDYVTKPFSLEELLARVRAQLRMPAQREASVLEAGDIRLDLRTRRVERNAREVKLTAREFELLAYLARHPDQVLSRADPQRGVGLRLRAGHQSARGLHRLPAPQARSRRQRQRDRDGAQRRLPAAHATWLIASCRPACARSWQLRSRSSQCLRSGSASSPSTGAQAAACRTALTKPSPRRRPSGSSCAQTPI